MIDKTNKDFDRSKQTKDKHDQNKFKDRRFQESRYTKKTKHFETRKRETFHDKYKEIEREEKYKVEDRRTYTDKQNLNISVLEGVSVAGDNLVSLTGRMSKDFATRIDNFKESKPLYNSTALKIFDNFRTVDSNGTTSQSYRPDILITNISMPTYAQTPSPSYSTAMTESTISVPQLGSGFTSNYTSYNTKKYLLTNNQNTRLQALFSMNQTYQDTPALNAVVKVSSFDQNAQTTVGNFAVLTA